MKDKGATSVIVVAGQGKANKLTLNCPKLIRFHELTEDEFFVTEATAKEGVTIENTSDTEPLRCSQPASFGFCCINCSE